MWQKIWRKKLKKLLLWKQLGLNDYRERNFTSATIGHWYIGNSSIWRGWSQNWVHVWCFLWTLFSSRLRPWSSLTLENNRRGRKWLCWDDGFATSSCALPMAFQGSGCAGAMAFNVVFDNAGLCLCCFSILLLSWLCPWMEPNCVLEWISHPPLSPFAFSTLLFPPAQLPDAICGAAGALAWLGITRLGQGVTQGNRQFSVPVGERVKRGLFYLPLDLIFLA